MKSFLLVIFFCFSVSIVNYAQNNAVNTDEKLVYIASYTLSGLLTEIAQISLETSPVKTSTATLLKLKFTATTFSKFDNFFKVRDLYESYVNPKTLTPLLYKRDIVEGGFKRIEQYKFNHKTKTIDCFVHKFQKNGEFKENISVPNSGNTKDLIATIYNVRNLDFTKLKVGQTKSFHFIFDTAEKIITIKYLGKETINSNVGKKECYKMSLTLKNDNALKGTNDNLLWLSADVAKIPVLAKFKIAIGTGELKIKSATGLLN
ncbi:MAG: DUF3108 domain-containing protein [Flavobacteriia bacterium]|nr:DUF3108 domain-containing protein [Flavobacteriia bacterium]OIP47251.1 MAG: hypothetical protein AUK46_05945 [Flavobacteriaceae bacterium CG2_30_31_66]PIV95984.1 MAG: DUF3108 domain-containing protein [Flavobacteriaceae bacterium CG17_big_fil_post_rev_8_21_14_2_50_31_13]PIX12132.1 MAG: DUF3108 domain-containing protein [Flavobacteriaceae bacterium CG_4_8_14_3_um_filter_31_8]PIY14074.1 MAG: DUF3108 domain-containing protein [Flavobacteriaceae bacterium CG_4_10_14_3_um_filter_31_253]PIZ09543.